MDEQVTLKVYRRLDNRAEGDFDDSSPLAWELHRRREHALEEVLDEADVAVVSWGKTRDVTRTHEFVELVVAVGAIATSPPALAILGWIGGVAATTLSETAVESIKGLGARLRGKQDENQIADFSISAGGRQLVTVYPDQLGGQVSVTTSDGRTLTTTWSARADDLPPT